MAHTLRRCIECGYVTTMSACQTAGHQLRDLSEAEANNYVRIGHGAFKEIPEPTCQPIALRPDVVEAFKRKHQHGS